MGSTRRRLGQGSARHRRACTRGSLDAWLWMLHPPWGQPGCLRPSRTGAFQTPHLPARPCPPALPQKVLLDFDRWASPADEFITVASPTYSRRKILASHAGSPHVSQGNLSKSPSASSLGSPLGGWTGAGAQCGRSVAGWGGAGGTGGCRCSSSVSQWLTVATFETWRVAACCLLPGSSAGEQLLGTGERWECVWPKPLPHKPWSAPPVPSAHTSSPWLWLRRLAVGGAVGAVRGGKPQPAGQRVHLRSGQGHHGGPRAR